MDHLVPLLAELAVTLKKTVTLSARLLTLRRAQFLKSNFKEPSPCGECSISYGSHSLPAFYKTLKFNTVFATARHFSVS
jgi:hypothetical protein